ncbi:MAG: DUF6675 family protein, partial [Spirochaetaceae bacterium]
GGAAGGKEQQSSHSGRYRAGRRPGGIGKMPPGVVSSQAMIGKQILALSLGALFIGQAAAAGAEPLSSRISHLDRDARRELFDTGAVKRELDSWRDAGLIPEHPLSEAIEDRLSSARPNVLSETLILVRRGISDTEHLKLYNSLRRVSELSDIEYYNPEKDKWHPLFDSSYRIPDENSDSRLDDPVVESIPGEDEILVRQGLPPFGETVSRYTYTSREEALHFSGQNLTRVTYRGFPVVGTDDMVTQFLLIREDDYLLVYGVGGARVFNAFGLLSGVIENSFSSRTTGLFDWYTEHYLEPLRDGELVSRN